MTTRHSLDGVELVAALVRHDPGLLQLWQPEWLIPEIGGGVKPDQLVILDTGEASALVLVEVDESTERPPIIRERLRAYARLFVAHPIGWHLLWVVNSPERLQRIREIAAEMRLQPLAGRSWGTPIGDVSALGASAHVLAVGASLPARPLRAIAADPKARRTSYPVGTPAWIRLVANGALEDLNGPWQGVERKPAAPPPEGAGVDTASAASPPAAAAVEGQSVRDAAMAATGSRVTNETPPGETTSAAMPTMQAGKDIELMMPAALVGLIIDPETQPPRRDAAVALLVERALWYQLFDAAEQLCLASEPDRQQTGTEIIRRVHPEGNVWFHRVSRTLLLSLVDRRHEASVVERALAVLEELGQRDRWSGS